MPRLKFDITDGDFIFNNGKLLSYFEVLFLSCFMAFIDTYIKNGTSRLRNVLTTFLISSDDIYFAFKSSYLHLS